MSSKSKISAMFRRAAPPNKERSSVAEVVEDAGLSYPTPNIDILDMELFIKDPDAWSGKAMFQYHLAMIIRKEYLGRAVVNPKDVIEQIEAKYWREPGQGAGGSINPQYPGAELLKRTKAAFSTRDNTTLDAFSGQLYSDIALSCRRLRNEKVVELDADESVVSGRIHRPTTPGSTASSSHSECNQEAKSTETEREIPTTENDIQQQDIAMHNNSSQSLPVRVIQPIYRSTSILYEYAASVGGKIDFQNCWIDGDKWQCVGVFKDITGTGEAQSKKEAKHIASQIICQALGIA
ncbi:hypothetical protein B0J11DRAFT_528682 [Dendryphion nanum]|uniref:DRBM domain-containing protein n=1 Tax=Dendryphion nanum TaxID=256645 RepID=A0A9P9DRY5_9PLEO|nr:hypothetical protein B0J11DRAFT_528682 [Dendryphion nanum]